MMQNWQTNRIEIIIQAREREKQFIFCDLKNCKLNILYLGKYCKNFGYSPIADPMKERRI